MKKLLPLFLAAVTVPSVYAQDAATEARLAEQEARINALADQLEKLQQGESKGGAWDDRFSIGGYGELHYNNIEEQNTDAETTEMDLHRFVLFFGYQFNNSVRMYSEFEVEHTVAGEDKAGEVEMEQAFIEWDYISRHRTRAGVLLLPVGILNQTHEPDTFYGVERNNIETQILPSTWYEGGIGFSGEILAGLNYDATVTEGLKLKLSEAKYGIRDARQKASQATAQDPGYTVALNYTGFKGLLIGGSVYYQSDLTQEDRSYSSDSIDGFMYEAHADWHYDKFAVRAVFANWELDKAIESVLQSSEGAASGSDNLNGFFIEPSYKLFESLGIFARYSEWDTRAGDSINSEYRQVDIGINYYLAPHVVLKADLQDQDADEGMDEFDGFNLGVGWSF